MAPYVVSKSQKRRERLRREAPIHHCAPAGFEPFWAITRHADIGEISKQPDIFLNSPGIVVLSDERGVFALPLRWPAPGSMVTVDALDHRTGLSGQITIDFPADLGEGHDITIT